jgi:YHS domain-containing protein
MRTESSDETAVTIDPVCGRRLSPADEVVIHHQYRDRPWHFCSEACRDQFVRAAARAHAGELARRGALLRPGERVRWGLA